MKLFIAIFFFVVGYLFPRVDTLALANRFIGRTHFFVQQQASSPSPPTVIRHALAPSDPEKPSLQHQSQLKSELSKFISVDAPPTAQDSDPFVNFIPGMYPVTASTMTEEEAFDILRRLGRSPPKKDGGGQTPKGCKYKKGTWSACDSASKLRTRTDTLRKGDSNVCDTLKTRKKECSPGRKGGKQRNNSKSRTNKLPE